MSTTLGDSGGRGPVRRSDMEEGEHRTECSRVSPAHPRFRVFCSLTDAEAAGLAPPYTRCCTLEYLLLVAYTIGVFASGFVILAKDCRDRLEDLSSLLSEPLPVFRLFGSVGYDNIPDAQYRAYQQYLPVFASLAAFAGVGSLWLRRRHRRHSTGSSGEDGKGGKALGGGGGRASVPSPSTPLATLHAIVGLLFISVIHGGLFFLPVALISMSYVFFTFLQRRRVPYEVFMVVMWVTLVFSMYLVHVFEGFERTHWARQIAAVLWPSQMRWCVAYRMYVLRMVSFNYDMWEANRSGDAARERALTKHAVSCLDCAALREQEQGAPASQTSSLLPSPMKPDMREESSSSVRLNVRSPPKSPFRTANPNNEPQMSGASPLDESLWCYKLRTEYSRDTSEYTYLNYMAYLLYMPIYLTGPITSFNAFVSHMHTPSKAMPLRSMLRYIARIFSEWLLLNTLMHFVFVNALSSYSKLLMELPISHQAYVMYYYLAYLWLKFSIMWRCSRLFSMWCGVEVPEDMRRCFSNTFSVRDFWRDWHASFNLWIVRYMYIPMGGRRRVLFSIAPIFFFIAIWHDHALHLMKWALCIVVMFVLEILVSGAFDRLAKAFAREMERVREQSPTSGGVREDSGAATAVTGCPLAASLPPYGGGPTPRAGHGNPRARKRRSGGVWYSAATFAQTRMSPQARRCVHRLLTATGAALSGFGLTCANLIGYNVQNSFAFNEGDVGSHTDRTIANNLRSASRVFYLVFLSCVWVACLMSTVDRQLHAAKQARMMRRYALTAPSPSPPPPPPGSS